MTIEQADSSHGEQQPGHLTVFHLLGLIMAVLVTYFLARDGWVAHGFLGALGGIVVGLVFAPIAFVVMTLGSFLILGSLAYIACDEIPVGLWLGRLRTLLRVAVIVGCVAWFGHSLPGMLRTTTWKELYDAALWGILLPFSMIFFLFISRFEKLSGAVHQTVPPGQAPPMNETGTE